MNVAAFLFLAVVALVLIAVAVGLIRKVSSSLTERFVLGLVAFAVMLGAAFLIQWIRTL